jgi:hypothetical protein
MDAFQIGYLKNGLEHRISHLTQYSMEREGNRDSGREDPY